MIGPLTLTDILKMLWWSLTHPAPKPTEAPSLLPPSRSVYDIKAETDKMEAPLLVVSAHDHGYREARLHSTTAILCVERGRKTLHEDHFPDEPPGKGFDLTEFHEGTKLTRVKVLLVQ